MCPGIFYTSPLVPDQNVEGLPVCQGPTATLGIYVDAGSVYEKPMQTGTALFNRKPYMPLLCVNYSCLFVPIRRECTAGTSHLLEYMAFKTTMNRSHFRLVREVRCQKPF